MKLTDNYISKIKHLDKDQFFSMPGVEGLTLQVYKHPQNLRHGFISTDLKVKIQLD